MLLIWDRGPEIRATFCPPPPLATLDQVRQRRAAKWLQVQEGNSLYKSKRKRKKKVAAVVAERDVRSREDSHIWISPHPGRRSAISGHLSLTMTSPLFWLCLLVYLHLLHSDQSSGCGLIGTDRMIVFLSESHATVSFGDLNGTAPPLKRGAKQRHRMHAGETRWKCKYSTQRHPSNNLYISKNLT